MHEAARFILGALLLAVLVTAAASAGGWWLAPRRRTARALAQRLGARPDAVAASPQSARGLAVSAAHDKVALIRFAGDPGLVYPLAHVRGVELIVGAEVKARAFRGEGRRPLDRIDPAEGQRVTLRLIVDDPADPAFEVDLWRPEDRVRSGWGAEAALREAREVYTRLEAVVQRASAGDHTAPVSVGRRKEPPMPDHASRPPDRAVTEHEDQKGGVPPRPSTEPAGGGRQSEKTQTNPATGEDKGRGEGSEKT